MPTNKSHLQVCCSVLQCVAVCCSVLQRGADADVYADKQMPLASVLQCVAVCCSVLQCVAVCCCVLQCVADVDVHTDKQTPLAKERDDTQCRCLDVYANKQGLHTHLQQTRFAYTSISGPLAHRRNDSSKRARVRHSAQGACVWGEN